MSESSATSSSTADPPRRWVDALLAQEEFVRDFLDSLAQARLAGEHEEIREQIRGFAESHPSMFEAVKRTLDDEETFVTEVRKQYTKGEDDVEDVLETLDDLASTYDALQSEFQIVWVEQAYGLWNTQPEVHSVTKYNEQLSMPTLEFTLSSGETPLANAEVPASQSLALAEILLRRTTDLLQHAAENDDMIDVGEQRSIADATRQLTKDVNRLQSVMGHYLNDANLVFESVDDPDWEQSAESGVADFSVDDPDGFDSDSSDEN